MSGFFRPEAMAFLSRWSEVAFGVAVMVFGWWITRFGGWIWLGIGGGVIALGLGWAVLAWRRLGFQADPAAPGLVELDEGRIRYLHPRAAGEISLADLVEIRLLDHFVVGDGAPVSMAARVVTARALASSPIIFWNSRTSVGKGWGPAAVPSR